MSVTRCKYCEYEHDTDFEAEHEEQCKEENEAKGHFCVICMKQTNHETQYCPERIQV